MNLDFLGQKLSKPWAKLTKPYIQLILSCYDEIGAVIEQTCL